MHTAVIARPDFQDRKGKPIEMAYVELSQCELDAPGAHVEDLELNAFAVVAEDRESEEFPAVVADRFQDVGHNVAIQVTSMEVKAKGLMIVKLDVKRSGGKSDTIVDSLYALNEDGDVIGGGPWINELTSSPSTVNTRCCCCLMTSDHHELPRCARDQVRDHLGADYGYRPHKYGAGKYLKFRQFMVNSLPLPNSVCSVSVPPCSSMMRRVFADPGLSLFAWSRSRARRASSSRFRDARTGVEDMDAE